MEIKKTKDIVVLRLKSADLTHIQETSDIVEDLLKVDGERKFVADLAEVHQINSLQAGALVTLHLLCYENLAVMKLAGVNEKVKIVLRLIGLDKLMEMHHGADVASQSFGSPGSKDPTSTGGEPMRRA
ncbi:MAG: STAS domain-containing protein [Planctomycetota bacterium]|nr:STAS domain-containing protein [Planctomycetota bacterium]